jgi:anti-anti-sigma regulatory factor
MTTRITKIGNRSGRKTTLRVEGSLRLEDAEVLESTYANLSSEQAGDVAIDLSGLSFLDSESASVLCRLRDLGVELVGLHFFTRQLIEMAEHSGE